MLRPVSVKDALKFSVQDKCVMHARRRFTQDVIFDVKRRLWLNTGWLLLSIECGRVDSIQAEKAKGDKLGRVSMNSVRYQLRIATADTAWVLVWDLFDLSVRSKVVLGCNDTIFRRTDTGCRNLIEGHVDYVAQNSISG